MSLQRVVAAPFSQRGETTLSEQEIVVALSLHRDWFSPAQSAKVVKLALSDGLLEETNDGLAPTFDVRSVTIPADFVPDESMMTRRTVFESILETLVAHGIDKREAVGEINQLQRNIDVTIDAAAALYAAKQGIPVGADIDRAKDKLPAEKTQGDSSTDPN